MKAKWTYLHSSILSTIVLFIATGALLVAHAWQSGALTLPFHGAAVSYFTLLMPLLDAFLSYLIHGAVTGDWAVPTLPSAEPPPTITLYQDRLAQLRPAVPATGTDPPLPPR